MDSSLVAGEDAEVLSSNRKNGGWITFPFVMCAVAGLIISGYGCLYNMTVYLIEEFNVKSISATQISNIVNGFVSLLPVLGAIISDSYLGCFFVISVVTFISFLGTILLTITASLESLRPTPCVVGSNVCESPSTFQFTILYAGITMAAIGLGCGRILLATMAANQFDKPKVQSTVINWYFFMAYLSTVVSTTIILYVEGLSWGWGFGLCAAANFLGWAVFVLGYSFYKRDKPQGSPFKDIARVVISYIRKSKVSLSSNIKDYYHGSAEAIMPKASFRFLNRAALKSEGDIAQDGSIIRPWKICTVQQVEDFKILIRIVPLLSAILFLCVPIAMQASFVVLQALIMDRHLGPNFKFPAASIFVVVSISTSTSILLIDRILIPVWQNLTRQTPTPLQLVGVGHVFNILSMVISAVVESKRLKLSHDRNLEAVWLVPQLVLVGIGEAFHFPRQLDFCYMEFPSSLQSTSTAMVPLIIGFAYYTSTGITSLIQRDTSWLQDDINDGRLDIVYWMLAVIGVLNFGYYLICSKLYKYQNLSKEVNDDSCSDK
ncbi:hypothetical protein ACFE04_007939 [Oxalis oulophora]